MNQLREVSSKKVSDKTEKQIKNCSHSVKRDREESPENARTLQQLKKKTPQTTRYEEKVESKNKATPKIKPRNNGADQRKKSGDNEKGKGGGDRKEIKKDDYLVKNDSALTDDLLEDFDAEDSFSDVLSIRKNTVKNKFASQESFSSTISSSDSGLQVSEKEKNSKDFPGVEEKPLAGELDEDLEGLFDDDFHENAKEANLGKFRRCKILDIEKNRHFTKITIRDMEQDGTADVFCYGFWKETVVEKDDIVSLKAKKDSNDWIIDNSNGFLVTQPYTLISGTSVVGAHFCIRRGVLTERFRGLDSLPNLETDDCGMTIGTFIHEVLQKVLKKKISAPNEIQKIISEITSSRRGIQMLYEANLPLANCKRQMEAFVPKIVNFVKRYIIGNENGEEKNFKGKIEDIREIEENVWLPELGLKGKIDVTAEVTVNRKRRIMPLELKTGRASFSAEHRGQIIIYSMMLNFLGHNVDSGLLLYIKENIMEEVKNNYPEERDLILLRNSLANYITRLPKSVEIRNVDGSLKRIWKDLELPEPINHRGACLKCPYNKLCSLYAERNTENELSASNVLKDIAKEAMSYLTTEHIEYVMNWITMLRLEDTMSRDIASLRDIWIMEPRMREQKGVCICNLDVIGDVVEVENGYLHIFVRKNQNYEHPVNDLSQSQFTDADYIIVSTDTRINVAAGHVRKKDVNAIEMVLDRDIVRQNPNSTFHLDVYPSTIMSTRMFANVACLLNDNEITNKLRSIIIEKRPATFVDKLAKSIAEIAAPILYRLNKNQRKAILTVLAANDYLLIKGMPGTGKTQTLVALVELLVKMGRSVLITAHTHSAIDNILLKLDERAIDFLRLGSGSRIHPALMHKSEGTVTANCDTPECLDALYRSKNVVAVTCMGATHSLVASRIFDVCLVDESTQVSQPVVLRPIYSASKFILVGDPQQLPPVVRSDEAKKMGMNESLFARLDNENNTITLSLQYRMNRRIMSVANELTYGGCLKAATGEVADATLGIKDAGVLHSCERWISRALSLNLEDSVVMLNTGAVESLYVKYNVAEPKENLKRCCNKFEAAIILRLVNFLQKAGIADNSIGVICPFVAQVELLRGLCKNIEVNTVDQYQGRDKDVILYSCTRSEPETLEKPRDYEILQDYQRLNVAVTRAKHKLVIIGDKSALKRFGPFEKLFDTIKNDTIDLEIGRDDFSWKNLVSLII